jgi:hypothetical protein
MVFFCFSAFLFIFVTLCGNKEIWFSFSPFHFNKPKVGLIFMLYSHFIPKTLIRLSKS